MICGYGDGKDFDRVKNGPEKIKGTNEDTEKGRSVASN